MKNIHLIATDKPSRLHLWTDENGTRPALCELEYSHTRNTQHIYITSDEEIKEGDYRLNIQRDYFKKSDKEGLDYYNKRNDVFKKVILTTDQDLIKDGVQAIDDEFLEWFVKNPSCEKIKIEWDEFYSKKAFIKGKTAITYEYKIIIPNEETTAYHYLSCCRSIEECHCGKYPKQIKCYCGHTIMCDCSPIEPKQETLKEAAEIEKIAMDKLKSKWEHLYTFGYPKRPFPTNYENDLNNVKAGLYEGAKWQQEQDKNKYSEEDMLDFAWYLIKNVGQYSDDRIAHFEGKYLEQFKKK